MLAPFEEGPLDGAFVVGEPFARFAGGAGEPRGVCCRNGALELFELDLAILFIGGLGT